MEPHPPSPGCAYRETLLLELKRRSAANARYSMRSFASQLGVSPAFLSKVLRAQKNLSLETAIRFSEALGFSETETERFCSSVRGRFAGPAVLKTADTHSVFTLSLDEFEPISDWYHYAILVLTDCRDFNPDPAAIGRRLGIPARAAELALQRMLKLGMLKTVRGRLKKSDTYVATPSDQASRALRAFHKQMIEKAVRALETQDVLERDITGVTLAIHPEKIPEAKAEIRKFRRKMAKLLDTGRPTSVYQLNIQFYRLSEEKKRNA